MADWVQPGWNKKKTDVVQQQSVSFKDGRIESFDNPNYRALDNNTDRYCRLAGALKPDSVDTRGRDELMGIFNTGHGGKTGLEAVKQYLSDVYDRAVDPTLDANLTDASGGRQTSWNKCFGIALKDPVKFTQDRFADESHRIQSTTSEFNVPLTPGALPAYCLGEVGVSDDVKNPWKRLSPVWERNAPPPGNGVYWVWGTPDGYTTRPVGEAFSFYYNFVNTGTSVMNAIVSGAFDNCGYIVLNGTKYPAGSASTIDINNGYYEKLQDSFTPFQVPVPRGVNTLEVRVVNVSHNESPAGFWLTIKVNDVIMVRSGCDGWRCNKFFYPAEVFLLKNVSSQYRYSYSEAPGLCQSFGATLASRPQLQEAQANGANWCDTGFLSGGGAAYPITYEIRQGCGNGAAGVRDFLPDAAWATANDAGAVGRASVNCFGNKPAENAIISVNPLLTAAMLRPFNSAQWSRYSPGTTPPPAAPSTQVVRMNNGSVSCDKYCGGINSRPWNGELPVEWNGATCVDTDKPSVGCSGTAGYGPGGPYAAGINCRCRQSGNGWYAGNYGIAGFQSHRLPQGLSDYRSRAGYE